MYNSYKSVLKISSKTGIVGYSSIDGKFVQEALSREPRPLCMLAQPSSTEHHWAVFRYTDGYFKMYGDYGVANPPQLVKEGYAPLLVGINEYTITTTSCAPWDQRPVDSPLIIVYNPTGGREDWVFTWHDKWGTSKFLFKSLGEDAAVDFIVFWEDLYYPPTPECLDD